MVPAVVRWSQRPNQDILSGSRDAVWRCHEAGREPRGRRVKEDKTRFAQWPGRAVTNSDDEFRGKIQTEDIKLDVIGI